jgi:hypothetical protein
VGADVCADFDDDMAGINITGQFGSVTIAASGGVVIDGAGNVGTYGVISGGPSVAIGASIGMQIGGSNAPTISDLRGPFAQVSGSVGAGPDVGVAGYIGATSDHQAIEGAD